MNAARDPRAPGRDWRQLALIAATVLLLVCAALVFLVLTGIIAEPETVIESILRTLIGQ